MRRVLPAFLLLAACGGAELFPPDGGAATDGGAGVDGGTALPAALRDEALKKVDAALAGADRARTALEILGLLPVYTCDEPRGTFVGSLAGGLQATYACASATVDASDPTVDEVVVRFEPGCSLAGHTLEGTLVVGYAGGADSMAVTTDFTDLTVDGSRLDVFAGYAVCGDETRYWATASGPVPGLPGTTFTLAMHVASREGPPVVGGTTLILDGTATMTGAGGTDTVTFTGLTYEVGELLPKEGTLRVETASGHTVEAVFTPALWRLGKMQVTVDTYDPVVVPIVR